MRDPGETLGEREKSRQESCRESHQESSRDSLRDSFFYAGNILEYSNIVDTTKRSPNKRPPAHCSL